MGNTGDPVAVDATIASGDDRVGMGMAMEVAVADDEEEEEEEEEAIVIVAEVFLLGRGKDGEPGESLKSPPAATERG